MHHIINYGIQITIGHRVQPAGLDPLGQLHVIHGLILRIPNTTPDTTDAYLVAITPLLEDDESMVVHMTPHVILQDCMVTIAYYPNSAIIKAIPTLE